MHGNRPLITPTILQMFFPLTPKMATSPEQVISFLEDMAARARTFAENDVAELRYFARTELGNAQLKACDLTYPAEKLRENRYAFSEQEGKLYVRMDKVAGGLLPVKKNMGG